MIITRSRKTSSQDNTIIRGSRRSGFHLILARVTHGTGHMSEGRVERRLAASLAVDVAGYSRLMGEDEEARSGRCVRFAVNSTIQGSSSVGAASSRRPATGSLPNSPASSTRCAVRSRCSGRRSPAMPPYRHSGGSNFARASMSVTSSRTTTSSVTASTLPPSSKRWPSQAGFASAPRRTSRCATASASPYDLGEQQVKNITRPVRVYRIRPKSPLPTPPAGEGSARSARVGAEPPLALPDKPSLAVLPFQNMTGDAEQEYFVDGMVEEITTAIARLPWLFVIARNSAFTYKGKPIDVKQVARELGVRYVLEGSVRKAGNRVRITGQLIDTATGAHIWADRFDGARDDIFELQDQVASNVAGAIEPKLRRSEIERANRKPRRLRP
jgi:TolB-like protein